MVRPLAELRGNHHHSVIVSDVKNVSVLERDLQDLIVHGQLFPTKVLGMIITKKKAEQLNSVSEHISILAILFLLF